MRQFIIVVAMLSASFAAAAPGNGNGNGGVGNGNGNGNSYHAAPGPILGAGPVGLAVAGVGYGVYWLLVKRRRKTG